MSAERDTTRIVRSWLRTDEHESADRVLTNVFAVLDATPQRRSPWSARRIAAMNTFAKLAMGAAAVVLVAVALLPTLGGLGGGPGSSASSTSPAPSPSLRPEPTPIEGAGPPAGNLAIGRHHWTQNGIGFSLEVPTTDWRTEGVTIPPDGSSLIKGQHAVWMPMWSIDGVFADPCAHVAGPVLSPSAADLAAGVAALSGFEVVVPPEEVVLGGRPATHVVIRATSDLGCTPADHFMWYDDVRCEDFDPCRRFVSTNTQVNRVWIWEVDGRHLWIEAETKWAASDTVEAEIQDLIASIEFD